MRFHDRADAGRRLGRALQGMAGPDVVVLGLPRGGVPVAFEVAETLGAPLDVIVVRKVGVPFQPELAMGAVGEGDVLVVNEEVVRSTGISEAELAMAEARGKAEVEQRARQLRGDRAAVSLAGRTAIVVDDGVATGSTARAACRIARARGAVRVVLATPVGAGTSLARLRDVADQVVCLETPVAFLAVGAHYVNFTQTTDSEVSTLLHRAHARLQAGGQPGEADRDVEIPADDLTLPGHLCLPAGAIGTVVFAHGSGSSRHSPRNRLVADVLNQAGVGTLLMDLLTEAEEHRRAEVFDVAKLARRLRAATVWLRDQSEQHGLPVGYFGASTGAAAALWSAAEPGADIAAVVSRGGRPDLAMPRLAAVRAPTLLIVGGADHLVLALNEEARRHLVCESRLAVVPGATHLFEEPGSLQRAAELARDWFLAHLVTPPVAASLRPGPPR